MTVCAGLDPLHPEGCLLRASWPHRGARAEVSKQTPRHRDSQTMQEENTDCLQQIFFYVPEMADFLCIIYFRKATNDLTFSGKSDLHNCFRVYRNAELHIRFHIFRNEMHGMVISRSTESDDLHICSHVSGNDGLHLGLRIFRKVTICICVFQFSKKMKVLIMYFHISRKLQNYKCGFANFRNDECHMCCRVLLKVINSICFC